MAMQGNDFSAENIHHRLQQEFYDSCDEELEMELDDLRFGDDSKMEEGEKAWRKHYFRELLRLQGELVKMQDWVMRTGHRMVIIFEGRDAAGKGGVIKRITQRLNPRTCRVAALPAAGEMVPFDRSWYNRAGVERVMVFCNEQEVEEFFRSVPEFEEMLTRSGIQIVKYWFSITDEEQELRFLSRIHDPLEQWKLSPMDLESRRRWEDYTEAKEILSTPLRVNHPRNISRGLLHAHLHK